MTDRKSFPYITVRNIRGETAIRPFLPLTLNYGNQQHEVSGLLDTGADVNVLPYQIGLDLGIAWDGQQTEILLSGNMANYAARGVVLDATLGDFPTVKLVFAWTRAEDAPVILGQVNFFMEFDVCFFRSRSFFEVAPKIKG